MDSLTPCPIGGVCEVLLHPACLPRRNARRHLLRAPLPGAQEVRLKKDPRAQDVRREDGAERAGRDGRNPPPGRRRHCGGTAAVAAVPARLPPSHRTPTSRAARASTVARCICARKARRPGLLFIYTHRGGHARRRPSAHRRRGMAPSLRHVLRLSCSRVPPLFSQSPHLHLELSSAVALFSVLQWGCWRALTRTLHPHPAPCVGPKHPQPCAR